MHLLTYLQENDQNLANMTVSYGVSPSPKGVEGQSRLGPPLNPPLLFIA